MERIELTNQLTTIFRTVFSDQAIILNDALTANDVERWDSLSNMLLVTEIENVFNIKFKLKDLNKMQNVGDMINIIDSKIVK